MEPGAVRNEMSKFPLETLSKERRKTCSAEEEDTLVFFSMECKIILIP